MSARLLCQAHRIPEKRREVYHRMYQIHRPGIGEIRDKAKRMNTVQQDANQFSLCALQFTSPQSINIVDESKKCLADKSRLALIGKSSDHFLLFYSFAPKM